MAAEKTYPQNIFVSLKDLLRMDGHARGFSFLARKQKVRSILGGKHASKLRGRGLDFEEVRNYVAGDDIRNIDWKVTARTQKTHTRVFSEEKEKPALIVVDQSRSMFFGSTHKTKSVVAAELAALSAFRVLKEGDRVGGVVISKDGIDITPPKRDRKNTFRFLETIVKHNRSLIDTSSKSHDALLKEALPRINNIVTHDFLVVVISDFSRYSPEAIKGLIRMSQHNDVILARVFDPLERDIPNTQIVMGDGQQQIMVKGATREINAKFSSGFNSDFEAFKAEMNKHQIPVFSISTDSPVEDQVKEILKTGRR
jgi:uncharacterized protein (DUF58 family)